jgi:hypothetical protein
MSNKKRDYHHQKSSSSDCGLLLFLECLPVGSISDVELFSEYSRMSFIGGLSIGGGGVDELVSSL